MYEEDFCHYDDEIYQSGNCLKKINEEDEEKAALAFSLLSFIVFTVFSIAAVIYPEFSDAVSDLLKDFYEADISGMIKDFSDRIMDVFV